jgi:uncharacterized membrane protein HdeD (DUF308 family)
MSLKAFHYVFVVISTLLSVGVGVWAIRECMRTGEAGSAVFGALALFSGVALLFYMRWVMRKLGKLDVR